METQLLLDSIEKSKFIIHKEVSYRCVGFEIDLDGLVYADLRDRDWNKKRVNIKFLPVFKGAIG